jgi:N-acetylmuramate 1-kinase
LTAATALQQWAHTTLADKGWLPNGPLQMTPVPGDAGFRHYYRLNTQPTLLAVVAPPTTEKNEVFVYLAKLLRQQGLHAPEVHAADFDLGFLLIEDLGDGLLLNSLNRDTANCLYGEVITDLLRLQQIPTKPLELPHYDQPLLRQEMRLFEDWFVPKLLGYHLSPDEQKLLHGVFDLLERQAADQPQVLVHRDFHSRNLIIRDGLAPGIVDFQDGVIGPISYDLVSLLRDCYIRWPVDQVERWALAYGNMAVEVGLMRPVTQETFLRWFDWMGLQRHLKVLGIFSRLHLRDGKDGYLDDLPLVIRYTLEVAEAYPELLPFADWFRSQLLPLAKQQPWYTDYRTAGDS